MLQSLKLYAIYFLKTALRPERRLLWSDFRRYYLFGARKADRADLPGWEVRNALEAGINWLITAQKATIDSGFCSYHLANGWSSSYPETTGYILPTLINYHAKYQFPPAIDAAVKAADFLLEIQKESGGWQGGRINENKREIVFNTGQVIRGMIAAYKYSGDKKYLESAEKAGHWLIRIQHPDGYWKQHALMEQARVYDTFVDAPLIELSQLSGNAIFREAAIRNLDWVVNRKMLPNGWFEDCDNTIKRNDKPILHTIAYTLDGLIDCSVLLDDGRYIQAAATGAGRLKDIFLSYGSLNGRYDRSWHGREFFICTGGAQMAIVWKKLCQQEFGDDFGVASNRMINYLISIQSRETTERVMTGGAIPGSYPIWGRYEPFAFPNWATKFFCDALLMIEEG